MEEKLLTIAEAAEILGVSLDTLRRWDKNGKLVAIRKEGGVHRYYRQSDLDLFESDVIKIALDWTIEESELPPMFYCENSAVFQTRLVKMQNAMMGFGLSENTLPLIIAVAGEIGNNSFDHNLGKWPDSLGIFFGFDVVKRQVVLADRGLGILSTLGRVRTELKTHTEAVKVAFTEIVSGRAPEERGNGLKFVRRVVAGNPVSLFFRSGDAELRLKKDNDELFITRSQVNTRGCFALIEY